VESIWFGEASAPGAAILGGFWAVYAARVICERLDDRIRIFDLAETASAKACFNEHPASARSLRYWAWLRLTILSISRYRSGSCEATSKRPRFLNNAAIAASSCLLGLLRRATSRPTKLAQRHVLVFILMSCALFDWTGDRTQQHGQGLGFDCIKTRTKISRESGDGHLIGAITDGIGDTQ